MAKFTLKILEHLHYSENLFEPVCAKDFGIDDLDVFIEQLDGLYREGFIEVPPVTAVDKVNLGFRPEIKTPDSKVAIGITVDGVMEIKALRTVK